MDKKKFSEGMAILCEQFQRPANEMLLKGYWMVLGELTNEQFESAVMSVLRNKTFNKMPLAAEILDYIHGSPGDKAILAANRIEQATAVGPYRSMVFDDPYIMATILSLGGWEHFCDMSATEEWVFFKKEIEKTYSALSKRSLDSIEVPLRLAGFVERNNSAMGITKNSISGNVLHKVEYVGDIERIKAWRGKVKQIEGKKETSQVGHVKGMLEHIGKVM